MDTADKLRYLSAPIAAFVVLPLLLMGQPQAQAWQTSTSTDSSAADYPIAFERNTRGDTSEVYRTANGQIFLRVRLAPGFIKFSPSNCPTLQVDQRTPVHHYQTGPACALSTDSVEILIAEISQNLAISLPLHRLMNGSKLAVRFVTSSGEYRESVFSLRNSKQALKTAIGDNVQVEPKAGSATPDATASGDA